MQHASDLIAQKWMRGETTVNLIVARVGLGEVKKMTTESITESQ